VVRYFDDENVHHVSGSVDPKRDREIINLELIFADIDTIERRIGENTKKVRSGDKDAKAREDIYTRVHTHLLSSEVVSTLDMTPEEKEYIRDLHLLTNKPFIYAVNLDESSMNIDTAKLRDILGITDPRIPVLPVSARIEMDMIEFSPADKKEFLSDMGIDFSPMDNIIKTCYDLLGLQYYFTAGETEVRAWTIHTGDRAPQAAGVIHTDFEKKFIKAETVNWRDLVEYGGWAGAREKGKVRMEGKEYVVADGDIMVFKFGG
jgi:GTP-binding protein YchF